MRLLLCAFVPFLALFGACGGPLSSAQVGTVCDTGHLYTCNLAQDTVLVCSSSNLWTTFQACDGSCTIEDPEGAASVCCDGVGGQPTCYEQNGTTTGPADQESES